MAEKVAVYTLGCKVNQYESEAIAEMFRSAGYEIVDFEEKADIYVINTCTVTHLGDRKSRQMIRRAKKKNPDALVVVTGCYAQASPGEVLALSGVNLVIGTRDRHKMLELLEEAKESPRPVAAVGNILEAAEFEEMPVEYENRTRAFMKIQEGCQNFCTYCIVPYTRGPLRSRKPERVIEEAGKLVKAGFKEIVLTGIHTGAYGTDLGDGTNLPRLIKELEKIEGLKRLRISSIDSNEFTDEFLEVIFNSPILCKHFHIPLQNGDDDILKKMNRKYTTSEYKKLIDTLRANLDSVAITTDFIVGFPGETEENFKNSYEFVRDLKFSGMHIFKYSPRKGTRAAEFANQVPPAVKEERSRKMMELASVMAREFAAKFIGETLEVLVEDSLPDGRVQGLTDNYLRVAFEGGLELKGELVPVKIKSFNGDFLTGSIEN